MHDPDAPDQRSHYEDRVDASFIDAIVAMKTDVEGEITLRSIVDRLDERAFGLLLLLLAIPCLVPGLPGAQLIAIPIFLLAAQLGLGRSEVWLPRQVLDAGVKASWINATADFADKRLRWTERVSRPRLRFLTTGVSEKVVGIILALASITIMLPITNTIPSLAITLAAVGLLQRDGLFTAAGAGLAIGWVCALIILIFGLVTGAGFAIEFVNERLPWLANVLGTQP
jgi:hypothetical protein